MTEEEMRHMLVLAHAIIANTDNLLNDEVVMQRLPYAALVVSQAQAWLKQYKELLEKELENL